MENGDTVRGKGWKDRGWIWALIVVAAAWVALFRFVFADASARIIIILWHLGCFFLPLAIVRKRKQPVLEVVKWFNICPFVIGCFCLMGGWPFWSLVVAQSVIYLTHIRNPKLTNGKKRMVVTFLVLSILGLFFCVQFAVRNGWHTLIEWWW